jgi:hypothetical protein
MQNHGNEQEPLKTQLFQAWQEESLREFQRKTKWSKRTGRWEWKWERKRGGEGMGSTDILGIL